MNLLHLALALLCGLTDLAGKGLDSPDWRTRELTSKILDRAFPLGPIVGYRLTYHPSPEVRMRVEKYREIFTESPLDYFFGLGLCGGVGYMTEEEGNWWLQRKDWVKTLECCLLRTDHRLKYLAMGCCQLEPTDRQKMIPGSLQHWPELTEGWRITFLVNCCRSSSGPLRKWLDEQNRLEEESLQRVIYDESVSARLPESWYKTHPPLPDRSYIVARAGYALFWTTTGNPLELPYASLEQWHAVEDRESRLLVIEVAKMICPNRPLALESNPDATYCEGLDDVRFWILGLPGPSDALNNWDEWEKGVLQALRERQRERGR